MPSLSFKTLPALSRGTTSKHYCDLLFELSLEQKTNLNHKKKLCVNKDFCNIVCLLKTLKH